MGITFTFIVFTRNKITGVHTTFLWKYKYDSVRPNILLNDAACIPQMDIVMSPYGDPSIAKDIWITQFSTGHY